MHEYSYELRDNQYLDDIGFITCTNGIQIFFSLPFAIRYLAKEYGYIFIITKSPPNVDAISLLSILLLLPLMLTLYFISVILRTYFSHPSIF